MSELGALIAQAERITCISHIHPDGDAVGSLLALGTALESAGKQVRMVLVDGVPSIFQYVAETDRVERKIGEDDSLLIVLDCNDMQRTGEAEAIKRLAKLRKLAYVDHHPKGDIAGIAAAILHRPEASSTCEIVYDLIMQEGYRLTPDIATALLTGMFTDTGGFQFPNTTNRTLEVAADLMRRGARLQKIVQEVAHSKSLAALRLLGVALERMRLTQGGSCAVSALTHEDIAVTGARDEDLAGVVNNLNELPDILCSLLLSELEPGTLRGTLRSGDRHTFNVGRLAKLLGGGGHPQAAGFVIPGSIEMTGDGWKIVAPKVKNL